MKIKIISHLKQITHFLPVWILLLLISLSSCIKDQTKQYQADENQKIETYKTQHGFTDSDTIGTQGVYFKYITETNGITPAPTDYAIISLTATYTDGTVFQTTDSATAKSAGFYLASVIYGPARVVVGNMLPGLGIMLLHMKEGSKAVALVPSSLAYHDYKPIVYTVTLHRIIAASDIRKYEYQQAKSYAMQNSITDTFPNSQNNYPALDSTFFRTIAEGDSSFDLTQSDSVIIDLSGYYAEDDTAYITKDQQRRTFFPINNSGTKIKFVYGETFFPLTDAVDSALMHMKIGGEMDMVVNSKYGFGSTGFIHPTLGTTIVPTDMSLHYRIKVDTMFNPN